MKIPKRGENLMRYANTFGVEAEEVWWGFDRYVNRPGELTWMIKAGTIEGTERERAMSFAAYLKWAVENDSVTGRIKKEIRSKREGL